MRLILFFSKSGNITKTICLTEQNPAFDLGNIRTFLYTNGTQETWFARTSEETKNYNLNKKAVSYLKNTLNHKNKTDVM